MACQFLPPIQATACGATSRIVGIALDVYNSINNAGGGGNPSNVDAAIDFEYPE